MASQKRPRGPYDDHPQSTKRKKTQNLQQVTTVVRSFYTRCYIYGLEGVTEISRCCLDSGCDGQSRVLINPSVARAAGLQLKPETKVSILADGSLHETKYTTHAPLTFMTCERAITLNIPCTVRERDSQSDSMLLSIGVMHALRGNHDYRTLPTIFQVTDPVTRQLIPLLDDQPIRPPLAVTHLKSDVASYVLHTLCQPAFAKNGFNGGLPNLAFAAAPGFGPSEVLQAFDECCLLEPRLRQYENRLLWWIFMQSAMVCPEKFEPVELTFRNKKTGELMSFCGDERQRDVIAIIGLRRTFQQVLPWIRRWWKR